MTKSLAGGKGFFVTALTRQLAAHCLLVLLCLFFPISSSAAYDNLTPEEKAYLDEHGPITFISQSHYPPFEFRENSGTQDGMTIELVHWLATELGFRTRFFDSTFLEAQQAVLAGKADVLTSFFYSEQRDRDFDFTQTLFEVPASIFVPVQRPDIVGLAGLNGKRIAIQQGDYANDFLEQQGIEFHLIPTRDFAEATDAVIQGRADAIIGDEQIVLYYLFRNNLQDQLKKVGDPLYIGKNCMAVRDGNQLLRSILDKGIEHARVNGIFERLNRKWVGISYPATPDFWFFWPYLAAIAGLILLVFIWNLRLRRAVESQTRALSSSEQRLKLALEGSNDGLWDWNPQSGDAFFSPRWQSMLGYEPGEIKQNFAAWVELLHPDDRSRTQQSVRQFQNNPDENLEITFRMRGKDGSWHWILSRGKIVERDAAGRPLRAVGTHQDITRRKEAEQRLQLQAAALAAAANAMLITDQDGRIQWANPAFSRLSGYDLEEVVGRNPRDLVRSGFQSESFYEALWQTISSGRPWQGELVNRRKDGSTYEEELTITPVLSADGKVQNYIAIKQDVSERKRLEREKEQAQEELFHAQKLDSLGRLAGGIAHDLNNLLVPIIGYSELVMQKFDSPEHPLKPLLQQINTAGLRASELIGKILAFGRRQHLHRKELDPNQTILELRPLLSSLLLSDITLDFQLNADLPCFMADSSQLEQALVNLCINARDAMPNGGTLQVSTSRQKLASQQNGPETNEYICITVKDTGHGIDPAVRDQILEPFFTTKPKGTGLGLSTVLGIVEQHGGVLSIDSEVGIGASFNLFFPATECTLKKAKRTVAPKPHPTGTEAILLVDDETSVLQTSGEILRSANYRVLEASGGNQALMIMKNPPHPINLILTDISMPQMNGYELARELREAGYEQPIVYMSGYSKHDLKNHAELDSKRFIQKPFRPEDLLRFIRNNLDARQGSTTGSEN